MGGLSQITHLPDYRLPQTPVSITSPVVSSIRTIFRRPIVAVPICHSVRSPTRVTPALQALFARQSLMPRSAAPRLPKGGTLALR
jgi:hypothetical protein